VIILALIFVALQRRNQQRGLLGSAPEAWAPVSKPRMITYENPAYGPSNVLLPPHITGPDDDFYHEGHDRPINYDFAQGQDSLANYDFAESRMHIESPNSFGYAGSESSTTGAPIFDHQGFDRRASDFYDNVKGNDVISAPHKINSKPMKGDYLFVDN